MIKLSNVSKRYRSGNFALNNLTLEIKQGTVLGLLGPNGSGKTTLMKLLQGYLKPTSGNIEIFGKEVGPETKNRISYLPDVEFIPKDYSILEAKELWKKFFVDFREDKFNELLKFMNLDENLKIGGLSKGMSEKFHLSLVLSRDADIYIIDEPIAGVDVVVRDKILEAILLNIEADKTLIITTHLIDELERLFDRVIFMDEGKILLDRQVDDLREEYKCSLSNVFKKVYNHYA